MEQTKYIKSQISLEGMEFFSYHGFYPEEEKIGCKYSIDLMLTFNLEKAGQTDDLNNTINYENVYTLIQNEMKINSKLIEHIAQRIIKKLQSKYPQLEHIDLHLYKYNPPLGGQISRVGIHLYI